MFFLIISFYLIQPEIQSLLVTINPELQVLGLFSA